MSDINQFDWVDFYKELAINILQYKDNRDKFVEKVKEIYSITGISMPTLERDNQLIDIDPFTFFGLFNKGLTYNNRLSIINIIAKLFDIKTPVPTSFDSIPVLNPQNATFYSFLPGRGKNDIQDLWELFDAALKYSDNSNEDKQNRVSKYFDLTINKKGNGNSKITMGLYWISPDTFLNLDQRNKWYIYESGKIPASFIKTLPPVEAKISSSKYFEIVEKMSLYLKSGASIFKDFKELSFEAWKYSDQVNKEIAEAKKEEAKRENVGAAVGDEGVETIHYWLYSPGDGAGYWEEFYNAGIIGIGCDAIGDLSVYTSKNEMKQAMKDKIDSSKSFKHDAHATWQFANEMKPGDIIFVKKGLYQIIGRGVVDSDYIFDSERDEYKNIRKTKWTHNGEWKYPGQAPIKFLTDITSDSDLVNALNSLFTNETEDNNDEEENVIKLEKYTKNDFLTDVYMDCQQYDTLVALIKKKKNVILQGAPGVGKTFVAKRLAYSMMSVKDPNRVMMIQFHQSYSYEDFIMGFRPTQEGGFKLNYGAFYDFCKSAENDSVENPYFFIIDEINRGNLSKIFGELLKMIVADKRGFELKLLYKNEKFSVPKNLIIIGMMNTADRSLAMIDYALRRRFGFFDLKPGFDTEGFKRYRDNLHSDKFNKLIDCVKNLNDDIKKDASLGEGFCIGHSYFCDLKETSDQTLSGIVEFELIPLIKEYWFDEPDMVNKWINSLRSTLK